MSNLPHSIHHINFPTTDAERTKEWYCKVFSMKWVDPKSNTDVLLLTRGTFDLHFTPISIERMSYMPGKQRAKLSVCRLAPTAPT